MTWLQFCLATLTVLALSAGQVLFKLSASKLELSIPAIFPSLVNPILLIALGIYGVATIMWLIVLKLTPLRVAYPFAALAFIFVPLLACYFLNESLSRTTFIGAAFIFAGVWISSLG